MDIRSLGYQRVAQFIEEGLIRDAADIYELNPETVAGLEGLGEKSAALLMEGIEASKSQPLANLLFALGVRHVGAGVARLLARGFGSMDRIANAGREEILGIEGVGEIIADSVAAYFSDEKNRRLIERLRAHGLTFDEELPADGPLSGQTVVVTGTLPGLSRQQATERIEAAGGKVTSGVSRRTSFVVAGEQAGSKLAKAQQLGVAIIDETELLKRLDGGGNESPASHRGEGD
jgi:DNA ligase (NAD+)